MKKIALIFNLALDVMRWPCRASMQLFFLLIIQFGIVSYSSPSFGDDSLWKYGDSIIRLRSEGQSRRMIVEAAGTNLAHVESGSILFDGRRVGSHYTGVFTSFHAQCGDIPYSVTGDVSSDQRSISFRGKAPQLNDACQVTGLFDRNFEIVFSGSANLEADDANDDANQERQFNRFSSLATRTYLHDPTRNWEVILDLSASRKISGAAIDSNGQVAAIVRGTNDSPRHLRLEFVASGASSTGRYALFSDDFDETWDNYHNHIEWQLKRITGDGGSPEALYRCDATCVIRPAAEGPDAGFFDSSLEWIPENFTSPEESTVVLSVPGKTRSQVLQTLSQYGIPAKITDVFEQRDFTVEVPGGSEQWIIRNMPGKGGIQSATYSFGPAGGSNSVRQSLADGTLISSWSPGMGNELWRRAACKLKSALAPEFRNTTIRKCSDDSDPQLPELCFEALVEGHTAEQGGFSSANLEHKLDNLFFVHSTIEFNIMRIPSPYSQTGYVERLVYWVVDTRVARQGPHDPVDQAVFSDVERMHINLSDRELDDIIVGEVQQIVESTNFPCASDN